MFWYYGWNVIAVAIIFQGITFGIGLFSITFFIQPWMVEFGASRADVLAAAMGANLALGAMGPFVGRAMDRLQIRYMVVAGGAVFSLGLVLLSEATSMWQIIVIYTLFIGGGIVLAGSIAGQTLAVKWFRARRGFAVGLVTIGTSTGGFLIPPLVTYLIEAYQWRTTCLVLAAVTALMIIPLSLWIIRNTPEEKGIEPEAESPHTQSVIGQSTDKRWTTRAILKDRAFWITVSAFLPATIVFTAIQQNLGPLADDLGINSARAALLMSIIAAVMLMGKLAFGAASDRFDIRYLFWVEAGLIVVAVVLLMRQPNFAELAFICAILGFSTGGTLPLLGAIVSSRFGIKDFGLVMGLLMPFLTVGSFGFVAAGWLRDTTGSYELAFIAYLALIIPAILSMAAMPKLRQSTK